MNKLTVSQHFVKAALSGANSKGFDLSRLLQKAGIQPDLLDQPKARIPARQYAKLMQIIWVDMQDEFMGFNRQRSKPGTFAIMCQLAIHCSNLEKVYRRASQYYSLFETPVAIKLSLHEQQATLTIEAAAPLKDPYHFLQESLLVIWHRLSCWLIGQRIILDEAFFNYAKPEHGEEYQKIFYCPLRFDAEKSGFSFHRRYLDMPLIRDERELRNFLKTSPADLLARPDDNHSFTAQIRTLIGKDFTAETPDFESLAQELNLSPQTLRRRLKDENTSYQEIKDHMRRDIAIYHLCRRELSINDIAELVGFTEPSTFHRAFKKWTGVTPGAYREGEREKEEA
ncbi:AraC family transcriptional regulator [Oleiphilus messinensis]|uniref:AraC family transcriptional regulator n=1 Tax=Oleiphilus messinensis TaxID=141451 RepID=A0A1Y0IBQ4_9GAMM|nr:AraC family transcriptional regulator [Oleiphilus messinensis]ARU57690.1 AraC family transcriptional regulator [Oleiphilus messinensis]